MQYNLSNINHSFLILCAKLNFVCSFVVNSVIRLFITSMNGSSSKINISQLDSIYDNSLEDVNQLAGNVDTK